MAVDEALIKHKGRLGITQPLKPAKRDVKVWTSYLGYVYTKLCC